jgi:hypothetical protein
MANRPARSREPLIEKIQRLPPYRVAEVEEFVDFLHSRETADQRIGQGLSRMSEAAFSRVWDNPDDADYDRL